VNTQEFTRIQLALQTRHRAADKVGLTADVQAYICISGFDPINLFDVHEGDSPGRFNDKTLKVIPSAFEVIKQS
jgi:hypothetical protein